jgi:hypothetical protein
MTLKDFCPPEGRRTFQIMNGAGHGAPPGAVAVIRQFGPPVFIWTNFPLSPTTYQISEGTHIRNWS